MGKFVVLWLPTGASKIDAAIRFEVGVQRMTVLGKARKTKNPATLGNYKKESR